MNESRNHQRKTARDVERTPVVSRRARIRVAENLTLKMRPPIRPPRRRKVPPIERGGSTTSLIRATPHGKGRAIKAFRIRARGMQKVCSLKKLMWRDTKSANSWETANWDWNARSTS
jgi:hypothetical protein